MKSRQRILIGSLVVLFVASALAFAGDPPGRVARIQFVSGSVSVQPTGTGDWAEAVINRPLTSTDNVWADKDARAELNVGTALAHIDSETSLTLSDVSDNSVRLQLHQGTLSLHVRKLNDGETYTVYAPDLVFNVQKPGDYKFFVNSEGDAVNVAVWKGEGDVTAEGGQSVHLREGQSAQFGGGAHTVSAVPSPDSFDEWCRTRNQREENSVSARYVSPEVIGSEDLDRNGRWEQAPTYGAVWVPTTVPAGWAPYQYGHWVWIDPWGWTWVDDQPWGFAPFHYGRWVYYNDYWAWAPGPYWGRPVYSPALVAWFGGRHWGVGLGYGDGVYGWCALGWGEPYYPWYGVSIGYFGRVNYHVHDRYRYYHDYYRGNGHWGGHYANSRWMTATNGHTIAGGLRVNQHTVNVSPHQLASSPMGGGRHDLAPTAASRLGGNPAGPGARPSTAMGSNSGSSRGFSRTSGPAPMRAATSGSSNQGGTASRNVPRPQGSMNGRVATSSGASVAPRGSYSGTTRNGSSISGGMRNSTPTYTARNVPRPTGQVMGASAYSAAHPSSSYSAPSRGYSAPSSLSTPRGNYSAPRTSGSYNGGSPYSAGRPSYGGGSSYSAPRNYGSSGGGSYSAPRNYGSYGGGSPYSGGRPSYGGGSYSAPRSSGSYSAPRGGGSYGGGHSGGYSGGGHASSGGGHSSGRGR